MRPELAHHDAIPTGMSPIYMPIGTVSGNGVAVLGSMGHLFVRGGSNGALDQYVRFADPAHAGELHRIVSGWVTLLRDRQQRIAIKGGVRFLQTLIPEKSSLYHHLLPPEFSAIDGPTRTLAQINEQMTATHSGWYIDALSVLRGDQSRYAMWPRTGSHWTPAGARALTVAILERISAGAASAVREIQLDSSADIESDLGNHLLGSGVTEAAPAPKAEAMRFGTTLEQLNMRYEADQKWSEWRCGDHLIDQRLLVFGNSYTQVIPLMDRLSWWFARVFREAKFVWTPEVQDEIIDEYKPDVVIAQGIERFLPVIPAR